MNAYPIRRSVKEYKTSTHCHKKVHLCQRLACASSADKIFSQPSMSVHSMISPTQCQWLVTLERVSMGFSVIIAGKTSGHIFIGFVTDLDDRIELLDGRSTHSHDTDWLRYYAISPRLKVASLIAF